MTPEEYQIWQLFQSGRIGSALLIVASAIFIWLGFRIASGTRAPVSGEPVTMGAKVMSSIFCLGTVLGTWTMWAEGVSVYVITAFGLSELKSAGTEVTEVADGFIEYVGTTTVSGTPDTMGMAFLVYIAIMYIAIIWVPKQS
jgi:hypothetical protein